MPRFTNIAAEKIAFAKAREARELAAANASTAATLARFAAAPLVRGKCVAAKLPVFLHGVHYANADAANVYAAWSASHARIADRRYSDATA
jgi:hypothetical protein